MSIPSRNIAVAIRRIFSLFLQFSGLLLVTASSIGVFVTGKQNELISEYAFSTVVGVMIFLTGLFFRPSSPLRSGTAIAPMAAMATMGNRSEMRHRMLLNNTEDIAPEIHNEVISLTRDTSSNEEIIALARRISAELAANQLTPQRVRAHEAAHAVTAYVLGHTITGIRINNIATNAIGGTVNWVSLRTLPAADSAFRGMHAAAAGWALDLMEGDHHPGSNVDIEAMHNFASMILSTGQRPAGYHGRMERDALVQDVIERTRGILIETRGAQEILIAALPVTGKLSGRRVHEILETALSTTPHAAREMLRSPISDATRTIDPEGSSRHTAP